MVHTTNNNVTFRDLWYFLPISCCSSGLTVSQSQRWGVFCPTDRDPTTLLLDYELYHISKWRPECVRWFPLPLLLLLLKNVPPEMTQFLLFAHATTTLWGDLCEMAVCFIPPGDCAPPVLHQTSTTELHVVARIFVVQLQSLYSASCSHARSMFLMHVCSGKCCSSNNNLMMF